jgi:hypothetical protein
LGRGADRHEGRGLLAAALCLLAALAAGCMAPATTGPMVARRGLKRTYTVPKVKPVASEDGFEFRTPHFLLRIAPEVASMDGYRTREQRTSRGLGAMLALESQYNFLGEVLGIEAPTAIHVFVVPQVGGREIPAVTRPVFRRDARGNMEVVVEVHFQPEVFADPSTRAHEITHAFTILDGLPDWLQEGFAVLVEGELAGGAGYAKQNRSLRPLGFDAQGYNLIQTWRTSQNNALPFASLETYAYSYSIVAELRDRFGDDFWKRFFQHIREGNIASGVRTKSDADIVAAMSAAAGRDLTPFFADELRFRLTAPQPPPASGSSPPADIPPLR